MLVVTTSSSSSTPLSTGRWACNFSLSVDSLFVTTYFLPPLTPLTYSCLAPLHDHTLYQAGELLWMA